MTDKGHVFGIGANSCGQLGQYYTEMKPQDAEEIFQAKPADIAGQSFGTYLETSSLHSNDNDNSRDSKNNDDVSSEVDNKSEQEKYDPNISDEETIRMLEGSVATGSMPQMHIFEEKQKESVSLIPKLIKSLMHRRVLKIASGGVHNICIVEPYPNYLPADIYRCLMKSKFTDVCFVFRERASLPKESVFEEDKHLDSDDNKNEFQIGGRPKNKLKKSYAEYKVNAHKFMLAARSPVFHEMFKKSAAKANLLEKKDSNMSFEMPSDIILIKDCSFKAFKVVLDYIYLDNLNLIDEVGG